jgi:hypothetical protein
MEPAFKSDVQIVNVIAARHAAPNIGSPLPPPPGITPRAQQFIYEEAASSIDAKDPDYKRPRKVGLLV